MNDHLGLSPSGLAQLQAAKMTQAKLCARCAQPFTPKIKRGAFCSARCRLDAWIIQKSLRRLRG